jgi:hypothetical protein
MRFDAGRWSILGDADEVRKSDERRKIVAALKEAGDEQTPAAIAKLTGTGRKRAGFASQDGCRWRHLQPRAGYYTVLGRPSLLATPVILIIRVILK